MSYYQNFARMAGLPAPSWKEEFNSLRWWSRTVSETDWEPVARMSWDMHNWGAEEDYVLQPADEWDPEPWKEFQGTWAHGTYVEDLSDISGGCLFADCCEDMPWSKDIAWWKF